MNKQSNNNAKKALNDFKMEIANEFNCYDYNGFVSEKKQEQSESILKKMAKSVINAEEVAGMSNKN